MREGGVGRGEEEERRNLWGRNMYVGGGEEFVRKGEERRNLWGKE